MTELIFGAAALWAIGSLLNQANKPVAANSPPVTSTQIPRNTIAESAALRRYKKYRSEYTTPAAATIPASRPMTERALETDKPNISLFRQAGPNYVLDSYDHGASTAAKDEVLE